MTNPWLTVLHNLYKAVTDAPLQRECVASAERDHTVNPAHVTVGPVPEGICLPVGHGTAADAGPADRSLPDVTGLTVGPGVGDESTVLAIGHRDVEGLRLRSCPRLAVVDVDTGGEEVLDQSLGNQCANGNRVCQGDASGNKESSRPWFLLVLIFCAENENVPLTTALVRKSQPRKSVGGLGMMSWAARLRRGAAVSSVVLPGVIGMRVSSR